jgi:hypothetical protein
MRTIVLLVAAVVLAGCGSDTCATGSAACSDACTGQCAAAAPSEWFNYLVWFGPADSTPPKCPSEVPRGDLGWADTAPTVQCAPCNCGPSSGSCVLPQQMNASTGATCGGTSLPFDAPEDWSGSCTSMDALDSASSIDAPPPYLPQLGTCTGSSANPVSTSGATRALVCFSDTLGGTTPVCPSAGDMCTYAAVPGFSVCLSQSGDFACPPGWPNKRLEWPDYEDCNCTCSQPAGEVCTSTFTVYSDSMCMQSLGSAALSSADGDVCIETAPGSPFGSKQATPPLYQSGTCTPNLIPSQVTTLCCLD